MQFSEDAMVAFVGALLSRAWLGTAPLAQPAAQLLAVVYVGVVLSDVLTYVIGAALGRGLAPGMRRLLLPEGSQATERALATVRSFGVAVGAVQRFCVGLRGPVCLAAGFTGMPLSKFALGAAIGASITVPLQLAAGYLLRDSPNPYVAMLAIVALPNAVGHLLAPAAAAAGVLYAAMQRIVRKDRGKEVVRGN